MPDDHTPHVHTEIILPEMEMLRERYRSMPHERLVELVIVLGMGNAACKRDVAQLQDENALIRAELDKRRMEETPAALSMAAQVQALIDSGMRLALSYEEGTEHTPDMAGYRADLYGQSPWRHGLGVSTKHIAEAVQRAIQAVDDGVNVITNTGNPRVYDDDETDDDE